MTTETTQDKSHLESMRKGFITELEPARRGFITNYPNFQHWKSLTEGEMNSDNKPLNIYLHIPYCAQKCAYCYYRTIQGSRKSETDRYVEALCKEIELASERFHLKNRPIESIYFGGGTPTLLDENNLTQIIETLSKHFNREQPHELSVEAEPVTLTQRKADALKKLNVNRISMGVQSLCDDIIKLTDRQDTEKKALRAIDIAQSTGAVVNIDLMSGLAGETKDTFSYSVNKALESGVESITVYKTELYANTKYYMRIRNDGLDLPTDEQELELMQYAMDKLKEANYLPWSFFTFTKEGKYTHVHSPNVFRGEDYYAFGASAFGRLGNFLFQNTNEAQKYIEMLEAGELPISRGHYLNSMDQMVRDVVLGMKLVRLDLNRFQNKYGFRLESLCAPTVESLQSDGFITVSDDEIALTNKGILYGDLAGKKLARCLQEKQ